MITRRELLKATLALPLIAEPPGDLVSRENARGGTRDWLLTRTRVDPATRYRSPWIEGYCSHSSLRAGETLEIYVSTNPPSPFRIDLYRMGYYGGSGARLMTSLGSFRGRVQLEPAVGANRLRECRWEPSARVKIPADWLSGVYLGKLMQLAASDRAAAQARAVAALELATPGAAVADDGERAHRFLAAADIAEFQKNSKQVTLTRPAEPPDGAPIGSDWCDWER